MEAANKGAFAGASASVGLNMELPNEQHDNPYQDVSLHFRHFFPRKVAFAKYAAAFVAAPNDWGIIDAKLAALYGSEEFKVGFFLGVPIWDHYPLP